MLQAVGYNALEGDEEDQAAAKGHGEGQEGSSGRSLEALLLAKNRHLEHELTMARLQVADLTGQTCSMEHLLTAHICSQLTRLQVAKLTDLDCLYVVRAQNPVSRHLLTGHLAQVHTCSQAPA